MSQMDSGSLLLRQQQLDQHSVSSPCPNPYRKIPNWGGGGQITAAQVSGCSDSGESIPDAKLRGFTLSSCTLKEGETESPVLH